MQRLYKMGHYPSTVYHYVVDKSMAVLAMTLCYSKHKALRQPLCLLWRLQQGSTQGKGTHSQEASVSVSRYVCLCQCWQKEFLFCPFVLSVPMCRCGCESLMPASRKFTEHLVNFSRFYKKRFFSWFLLIKQHKLHERWAVWLKYGVTIVSIVQNFWSFLKPFLEISSFLVIFKSFRSIVFQGFWRSLKFFFRLWQFLHWFSVWKFFLQQMKVSKSPFPKNVAQIWHRTEELCVGTELCQNWIVPSSRMTYLMAQFN